MRVDTIPAFPYSTRPILCMQSMREIDKYYFTLGYSRISTLVLPTTIPGPASVQELSDHL